MSEVDAVSQDLVFSETATAGTYTASLDISLLALGNHSVDVIVTDSRGLSDTASVDFTIAPPPSVPTTLIIDSITYAKSGRDLLITVLAVDDFDSPVGGASISIALYRNGSLYASGSSTTNSSGKITFRLRRAPSGCYETKGTAASASTLTWDGNTPANGFCK